MMVRVEKQNRCSPAANNLYFGGVLNLAVQIGSNLCSARDQLALAYTVASRSPRSTESPKAETESLRSPFVLLSAGKKSPPPPPSLLLLSIPSPSLPPPICLLPEATRMVLSSSPPYPPPPQLPKFRRPQAFPVHGRATDVMVVTPSSSPPPPLYWTPFSSPPVRSAKAISISFSLSVRETSHANNQS